MELKVYKYELKFGENKIDMPEHASALSVKIKPSDSKISLWALVDPDPEVKEVERRFLVVGTGHPIRVESPEYVDTVIAPDGFHVWHIFEDHNHGSA